MNIKPVAENFSHHAAYIFGGCASDRRTLRVTGG